MPLLARRSLLRQLAPVLLSASATSLLGSPAQAAGTIAVEQTLGPGQTLQVRLSDLLAGRVSAKKVRIVGQIKPGKGKLTVKGKDAAAQITYRPLPGYAGSDAFSLAILAGAVPYTVRVGIVVTAPEPPPPSSNDILVSDAAQLSLALTSAKPGSRILLANGSYAGNFAVTVAGTPDQPVVIEAQSLLGATVAGSFLVKAADVSLKGLVITGGIVLNGDRARASRCRIESGSETAVVEISGGTGVVVELCEMTNFGGRGIQIGGGARAPRLYRNWIHGQFPDDNQGVAAIISGLGKNTSALPIGAHILENLLEGLSARQAIETKSSSNRIERNTVIGGSRPGDVLVRHGLDNVLIGNWVENGRLLVGDRGSIAAYNRVGGTRHEPCLGVKAGTLTGDQLRTGMVGYPISEGARLIANQAVIDLGWHYDGWTLMPLATSIEAHDQAQWPVVMTLCDPLQVTYSDTTDPGLPAVTPQRLTSADVGPFAQPPA